MVKTTRSVKKKKRKRGKKKTFFKLVLFRVKIRPLSKKKRKTTSSCSDNPTPSEQGLKKRGRENPKDEKPTFIRDAKCYRKTNGIG